MTPEELVAWAEAELAVLEAITPHIMRSGIRISEEQRAAVREQLIEGYHSLEEWADRSLSQCKDPATIAESLLIAGTARLELENLGG